MYCVLSFKNVTSFADLFLNLNTVCCFAALFDDNKSVFQPDLIKTWKVWNDHFHTFPGLHRCPVPSERAESCAHYPQLLSFLFLFFVFPAVEMLGVKVTQASGPCLNSSTAGFFLSFFYNNETKENPSGVLNFLSIKCQIQALSCAPLLFFPSLLPPKTASSLFSSLLFFFFYLHVPSCSDRRKGAPYLFKAAGTHAPNVRMGQNRICTSLLFYIWAVLFWNEKIFAIDFFLLFIFWSGTQTCFSACWTSRI